jgi:hypothetical protein
MSELKFRNPDGTWNGINVMSAMTGLSTAEVEWTAKRLIDLMHHQKRSREEALAIVREEAKTKPWEA